MCCKCRTINHIPAFSWSFVLFLLEFNLRQGRAGDGRGGEVKMGRETGAFVSNISFIEFFFSNKWISFVSVRWTSRNCLVSWKCLCHPNPTLPRSLCQLPPRFPRTRFGGVAGGKTRPTTRTQKCRQPFNFVYCSMHRNTYTVIEAHMLSMYRLSEDLVFTLANCYKGLGSTKSSW